MVYYGESLYTTKYVKLEICIAIAIQILVYYKG